MIEETVMTDAKGNNHLIADPDKNFQTPHDLADDPRLSDDEKLKALKNWEDRLRRRLMSETRDFTASEDPRTRTVPGVSLHDVQEVMARWFADTPSKR